MSQIPWLVKARDHLGLSAEDMADEPDWDADRPHRVGFKTWWAPRRAGITHSTDDEYRAGVEEAWRK